MNSILFASNKDDWETPPDLFNALNDEFHFTLDVCANYINAKVSNYYTLEQDGLTRPWKGVCWCNPPYGRGKVKPWVAKAAESAAKGVTTVMLLAARTDTTWFHDYIYNKPNVEVRFIRGRLKFVRAEHPAPFPSMIVIFRPLQV